ncbi:cyclin-I [Pholidichthys leucotaenia]
MWKLCCLFSQRCVRPGCILARVVEVETPQLDALLEAALLKEARLCKVPVFKNGCIQGTDISWTQHREMILWLGEMNKRFHFRPETFALGVCILNRLVSSVKAQPKYLKCIAFTSMVLAAKLNEEDEVIGSVKDLVVQSGCSFSSAEILRMERTILDKLHWDLYTATPVDFIHIFHALLVSSHPHLIPSISLSSDVGWDPAADPGTSPTPPVRQKTPPGLQAALWTRQVQHCMACHQLWQFKGSTLALAIISLELEALTPNWFSVFTDLLNKVKVDTAKLVLCREMVDKCLNLSMTKNAVDIVHSARAKQDEQDLSPAQHLRHTTRSSREQGDVDESCDRFRRLYSEETAAGAEVSTTEGFFESPLDDVSPCPPRHV